MTKETRTFIAGWLFLIFGAVAIVSQIDTIRSEDAHWYNYIGLLLSISCALIGGFKINKTIL